LEKRSNSKCMGWITIANTNQKPNGMSYGRGARDFEYQQKRLLNLRMTNSIGRFLTDKAKELLTDRQIKMLTRGTAQIAKCKECGFSFIAMRGQVIRYRGLQNMVCWACIHNQPKTKTYKRLSDLLGQIKQAVVDEQNKAEGIVETDNE